MILEKLDKSYTTSSKLETIRSNSELETTEPPVEIAASASSLRSRARLASFAPPASPHAKTKESRMLYWPTHRQILAKIQQTFDKFSKKVAQHLAISKRKIEIEIFTVSSNLAKFRRILAKFRQILGKI